MADNPPEYYICGICGKPVHTSEVSLDHIKPVSVYPHLEFDVDNVRPTHGKCNMDRSDDYSPVEYDINKKVRSRKRKP